MTTTTKQDRHNGQRLTSQGVCPPVRWRLSLLLLLFVAFGAQGAWAQKTFPAEYQTVKYAAGATYDLQQVTGFASASYSIDATAGDVGAKKVGEEGTVEILGAGTVENPYKISGVQGGGAIRIKAEESGTGTDATYYVLTVAYPTGTTWDFRTVTKEGTWTDGGTRHTYDNATMGSESALTGANAFVIPETAGLLLHTDATKLSVCEKDDPSDGFQYVGISGIGASFTIPGLSAGDVVELNMKTNDVAGDDDGKLFSATNVTDLAGTAVSETFTIADCDDGRMSFLVAADGDVTFTLQDAGICDILSVRTYSGGYVPSMETIALSGGGAPPVWNLLNDAAQTITLKNVATMNATASGGHAKYVDISHDTHITAYSLTEAGVISATSGYGKATVRLNDYTADSKYLIGYTAEYTVTYGSAPHQSYPFTWNFENISGGALLGRSNNAASSITTDYLTWTGLGYETYMLDTNTGRGSLYVPGATLVSATRSLGKQGSVNVLNRDGLGNDEFNGLGFEGQIAFKVAQQGETANNAPDPEDWTVGTVGYLLDYTIDGDNDDYKAQQSSGTAAPLTAGDGQVQFGALTRVQPPYADQDKETGTVADVGSWVYRMDGGNTKYLLLMPQRPLQNGDVIHMVYYVPYPLNGHAPSESGFSFYANSTDAGANALVTCFVPANVVTYTKYQMDYTVTQGDGLAGRSQVYLFRALKTTTIHLQRVWITGDDASAPASYSYERAITCVEATTITIPDLTAGQYVYIKSSAEGSSVTNLTAAVTADGLDAKADGDGKVYRKYKVDANGNAAVTFAADTKVYSIGVTGITKPLTRVGSGDAWATDSRPTTVTQDAAIDYTQTGKFTVNDIKANIVSATKYTTKNVTVKMNPLANAVPAETGVVLRLKLKYTTDDEKSEGVKMTDDEATTATTNAVDDFAKAKDGNAVPLFAPPHSATILSSGAVGFGGTQGNLMKANVTEQTFTSETETIDAVDYTRFIFANRYMKWQKVGTDATYSGFTDTEGDVPVFYRMHLYSSTEAGDLSSSESTLNTLGANKAYMLIRSTSVPDALWKDAAAPAREFIGIEGVSEFSEDSEYSEDSEFSALSGTYNLRGQRMDDAAPLSPGVYIRNGKKIIVK